MLEPIQTFLKTGLVIMACCLTSFLQALPVGNPAEIGALWDGAIFSQDYSNETASPTASFLHLKSGFYGNYVFNRFLKTDTASTTSIIDRLSNTGQVPIPGTQYPNAALNKNMYDSESISNAVYIGLNFKNRLEFFGTFGATHERIEVPSSAFNLVGTFSKTAITPGSTPLNDAVNNGSIKIRTDSDFAWSSGTKLAIIKSDYFTIAASFQYGSCNPNINHIDVYSDVTNFTIEDPLGYESTVLNNGILVDTLTTPPTRRARIKSKEWQGSLGLSSRLNDFIPYIAFKLSGVNLDGKELVIPKPVSAVNLNSFSALTSNANTLDSGGFHSVCLKLNKLKSRKHYGLAFGATFIEDDRISVTVEGRLIDENALFINALFRV